MSIHDRDYYREHHKNKNNKTYQKRYTSNKKSNPIFGYLLLLLAIVLGLSYFVFF